jgi:undecaprenyl-diphosphatase
MTYLEAAFLGLVQGLTEFLPISSSAHLRIAGYLLPAAQDPGAAFTAIVQIGTEAAVVIYFWSDIRRIAAALLGQIFGQAHDRQDARLGWLVVIGSLPIVVLGLLGQDLIETSLRNLYITAAMLILFGLVLGLCDRLGRKTKALSDMTWRDGVIFGLAQAMALIPGVSRSGGTISAGLAMGYTRQTAARYSFLLAIPAVFGSGFYQLWSSWGETSASPGATAIATAVSFVVGYGVIAVLLRLLSVMSFTPFVIYRVFLGLTLLALLWFGVIPATS